MTDLTPQQAQLLLDKLANDDAFRTALSNDPAATLQSAGLPTALAPCVSSARGLPSKQTAQAALSSVQKVANSTLGQDIHNLVAK